MQEYNIPRQKLHEESALRKTLSCICCSYLSYWVIQIFPQCFPDILEIIFLVNNTNFLSGNLSEWLLSHLVIFLYGIASQLGLINNNNFTIIIWPFWWYKNISKMDQQFKEVCVRQCSLGDLNLQARRDIIVSLDLPLVYVSALFTSSDEAGIIVDFSLLSLRSDSD